jgi:hypothetical protein
MIGKYKVKENLKLVKKQLKNLDDKFLPKLSKKLL